MTRHLVVGSWFVLVAAVSLMASGCSSTNSTPTGDGGWSCKLGGECSQTQLCMGIEGCTSNCQCLDGTWQAPCPGDVPETGSACTPEGASCGYSNQPNPCGASNCYCQSGAWSCGPTCVTIDAAICDPRLQNIQASNYDRSCTTDSDCIVVGVGNACSGCPFLCGMMIGAVNVGAGLGHYRADIDMVPTGTFICAGCPEYRPFPPPLCCRGGQCHADNECSALDGSTDAFAE